MSGSTRAPRRLPSATGWTSTTAVSVDAGIHFAFGDAAKGEAGFRVTHKQAAAAQAVMLAAESPAPRTVTFRQVASVAMMLAARELLHPWVLSTLVALATDTATSSSRCGQATGSARRSWSQRLARS